MDAFASAADLGKILKRTFEPGEETEWIDALLADASTHLRSVIEQDVYPRRTTTYTAYPSFGREDLPQWPVVSVDAVERDGNPISFTYRPGFIMVGTDGPCEVTFTWGYKTVPRELQRLACVLVSQALIPLENDLGLTAGGLSSVAIDDFKLAWADAGASSGMALTEHAEKAIRKQFGRGDITMIDAHW